MEWVFRVHSVSFSPSGDHLAVGGKDKKVAILNTSTWEIVHKVKREGWVYSADPGVMEGE